jgi:signal transduction histidine kinase/CheY-like chemotaxis protein
MADREQARRPPAAARAAQSARAATARAGASATPAPLPPAAVAPIPPAASEVPLTTPSHPAPGADAEVRARAFQALHEVAVAVGGLLDTGALVELATERARALLGIDGAAVYWWDADAERLFGLTQEGPRVAPPEQGIALGEGLIGQTFVQRKPIVVEDYQTWEHALTSARRNGAGTGAAVPIFVGDRTVGVLAVGTFAPYHYAEEHVQLLALLAAQVGPAIEAARLYAESERRRAEAEALAELARQGAAEPGTDRVVALVTATATRLLDADYATVALIQPSGRVSLYPAPGASPGAPAAPPADYPANAGHVGQALVGGHTVVMEQLDQLIALPKPEHAFHRAAGGRTVLATPLRGAAGALGALVVGWCAPRCPRPEQVRLAEALAGYAGTVLDNAQAHAEVAVQAEAFARTEKLRALGQMASGAAHDLNQYLAVIAGYSDVALRALDQPAPDAASLRDAVRLIAQAAMDGADTVKRLLAFSRPHDDTPAQPVDVTTLLRDVAKLTAPRWRDAAQAQGRPIALHVECEQVVFVQGWPESLREALTNLVFNAVDALPRGGTIRLVARDEAPSVVLEVIDDGVGMSAEVQARVFEPFFTTKGERGTGLGLAMVFGIVERHGGQIAVQSAPGRGTTVRLTLPAAGATASEAPAPPSPRAGPRRILAVDDEPAITRMVAAMLEPDGHTVVTASSGEEALARLAAEPFDVVLSDIGMGAGMNGWDLAARVHASHPGIAFALATGWGAQIEPAEAEAAGVAAVIAKPYRLDDLRRLVATLSATAS